MQTKKTASVIASLLCAVLLIFLAACTDPGGSQWGSAAAGSTAGRDAEPESRQTEPESEPPETAEPASAPQEPTASARTVLVVYFSRTGEQYNVGVIDKGKSC